MRFQVFLFTAFLGCGGDPEPQQLPDDAAPPSAALADGGSKSGPIDAQIAPSADARVADAQVDAAEPRDANMACDGTCTLPAFCPMPGYALPTSMPWEQDGNYSITIKFVEGSHVRMKDGRLGIDRTTALAEDPGLLCCRQLTFCEAERQLNDLADALARQGVIVDGDHGIPDADLDRYRAEGREMGGQYLNDGALYYNFLVPKERAEAMLSFLRGYSVIDIAYLGSQVSLP